MAVLNKKSVIHVLHVDDDPSVQEITKLMFLDLDSSFEIDQACCVDEALKKLSTGHYDVVVSDFEMPKKNGLQFLTLLREQKNYIPFILFTGKGREEVAIKALNLGADGYYNKQGSPETTYGELAYGIRSVVSRRKAEEALKASEESYHDLINAMNDTAWVIDFNAKFVDVNNAAVKVLGYSREEFLSMGPLDIDNSLSEEQIKDLVTRMQADQVQVFETTHTSKKGKIIPVEISSSLVNYHGKQAVLSIARNITERKKAEKILLESEEKFRNLAEESPNMIFINLKGRVVYANKKCEEILGYSRDEFYSANFSFLSLVSPEYVETMKSSFSRHMKGEDVPPYEYVLITRDGKRIDAIINSKIIKHKNDHALLGIVTDITERKKTERMLVENEERLRLKLNSVLSPDANIDEQELTNVLDLPKLQAMMDDLYSVTKMTFALIDLKGNVLVKTGWQDICTKFHRTNPKTLKNCIESDIELTTGLKNGEIRLYKCKNNMWDVVTPLMINGKHVANIFSGQFFFEDETTDRGAFVAQAEKYSFNKEEYISAFERAPRWSREKIQTFMLFNANLSEMISKLSYSTLKLAKALSDQKAVEQELRENDKRFRQLSENAEEWIWEIDSNGLYTYSSAVVEKLLGYKPEEIVGKKHFYDLFLADEQEELKKAAFGVFANKSSFSGFLNRNITKNGDIVWLSTSGVPILNEKGDLLGYRGVDTDITDRKKNEDALKQERVMLESVTKNIGAGLVMISKDYKILWMNNFLRQFTGASENDHCYSSFNTCTTICPDCGPKKIFEGAQFDSREYCNQTEFNKDHPVWFELIATPVKDTDGNVVAALELTVNITEKKEAEKKLKENSEKIELMNEKLRVVGGLTRHDVRNKLSTVTGYSYLLKKKYADQTDIVEGLGKMEQAVKETIRIFEFAKMYEQLGAEELVPINVEAKLTEATTLFSGHLPEINNECYGLTVLADSFLRQLFYNFIDNTRKYGQKTTSIKVHYEKMDQGSLKLVYEDDGVGLSLENKPKLFKEGFSTGGSTGFGLFLTKKMMDVYGWTIEEKGEPGKGAKFIMTIPKLNKNGQENYHIAP